jgi:hypothetical protein
MQRRAADLESWRDAHRGERCVVLGNGPSLRETPLELLRGEHVFIVNRGHHAFGFGLTGEPYLVVSDPRTYATYATEIRAARVGMRFYRADVTRDGAYLDAKAEGDAESCVVLPFHMAPTMDEGAFACDVTRGLHRGFTVVLDAVQLAYFMGFRHVIMLGVDLTPAAEQTHFYGSGTYERSRRNDMPVPRVQASFATARRVFEADGRRLVNATPGGSLSELERIDLTVALSGHDRKRMVS